MGVVVYIVWQIAPQVGVTLVDRGIKALLPVTAGVVFYLLAGYLIGMEEVGEYLGWRSKK